MTQLQQKKKKKFVEFEVYLGYMVRPCIKKGGKKVCGGRGVLPVRMTSFKRDSLEKLLLTRQAHIDKKDQ